MDPNAAYRIAADAAERLIAAEDEHREHRAGDPDCTCNDCMNDLIAEDVTNDERGPGEFAIDLAESWQNLDQWIRRGGFLPDPWKPAGRTAGNSAIDDSAWIEGMIDRRGLADVLRLIEDIAHAKAEHVESTWQDRPLAKAWTAAAGLVARTASRVADIRTDLFGPSYRHPQPWPRP